MHVLGIDAGGTKTVCFLADDSGAILAEARGPGANLQAAGELEVEKVLHGVMERAFGDRRGRPDAICLGMAGVDREDDAQVVRNIMRRISPGSAVLVVNDALVALVAGVGAAPGVVVVAGTGSIAYGRNADGLAARAGGWGHVIGDEGSGYWIGRRALAAVVRDVDGRGPRTWLTHAVLDHFGVRDAAGLIHIVYNREVPRASVATLGPVVQAARDQGDAVAADILDRAADELSLAANSVVTQLEMRGASFSVILAGGMFNVVPWLVTALQQRLAEVAPRADVRRLAVEPAVGAIRLALDAARGSSDIPQYVNTRTA
jgi:N-acetylglucosamine kinase-like BadF-type ATPase